MNITSSRYLVPKDMTAVQFMCVIRKRIKLQKDQALFLFVEGREALKGDTALAEIYTKKKDGDGFLYIAYAGENVLG